MLFGAGYRQSIVGRRLVRIASLSNSPFAGIQNPGTSRVSKREVLGGKVAVRVLGHGCARNSARRNVSLKGVTKRPAATSFCGGNERAKEMMRERRKC